jgi:hypothetical protein
MPHRARSLELLLQTICEVDTVDELARVRATARDLYAYDEATLAELTRAIDGREAFLRTQLVLFPIVPADPIATDETLAPAPQELVREWCEQVREAGPDELDALEQLTHAHWDRASLRELRGAIEHRRRLLGG